MNRALVILLVLAVGLLPTGARAAAMNDLQAQIGDVPALEPDVPSGCLRRSNDEPAAADKHARICTSVDAAPVSGGLLPPPAPLATRGVPHEARAAASRKHAPPLRPPKRV